jgi:hypothetical protein
MDPPNGILIPIPLTYRYGEEPFRMGVLRDPTLLQVPPTSLPTQGRWCDMDALPRVPPLTKPGPLGRSH